MCEKDQEIKRLTLALAERDALLRDLAKANREYFPEEAFPPQHPELMARIEAALSASAEQSAPVEIDERAAFEKYECEDPSGPQVDPMWMLRCTLDPEKYGILSVQSDWDAWQARAALERKPSELEIAGYEGSSGLYYSKMAAVANGEQVIEPVYRVTK